MKAVLRGRFIDVNAYIKKEARSQVNHLTLHLDILQQEEQSESKDRFKKIKEEINEIKNRKTIKTVNEKKSPVFGKINKIYQPLAIMT